MNPLREQLNRHKWKSGDIDKVNLTVQHRGAPNDEATISGSEIGHIGAFGITVSDEDGAFIPYHRILRLELPVQ